MAGQNACVVSPGQCVLRLHWDSIFAGTQSCWPGAGKTPGTPQFPSPRRWRRRPLPSVQFPLHQRPSRQRRGRRAPRAGMPTATARRAAKMTSMCDVHQLAAFCQQDRRPLGYRLIIEICFNYRALINKLRSLDAVEEATMSFQHIFYGRLLQEVKCYSCGVVSRTFPDFVDISVDIIGVDSIEKAISNFFELKLFISIQYFLSQLQIDFKYNSISCLP